VTSLATRIGLGYLALTALAASIGVFAALRFVDLGGSVGRMLEQNYRSVLAAENMVQALDRQEAAVYRARVWGDPVARSDFERHRAEFLRWYADASPAAAPVESALLDSLGAAYGVYTAAAARLFAGTSGAPVEMAAARVRWHISRLLGVNQDAMLATRTRVERAAATATVSVVVMAALAALGSLLAGRRFARGLTRPLRQLTESVARVRRGHLGEQVPVTTNDEVGALAAAFNQMTARLKAYEATDVRALMAEKQKAESLIEATPGPLIVTDAGGRVVLLNRAAQGLLGAAGVGQPLGALAPSLVALLDAAPPGAPPALLDLPRPGRAKAGGAPRTFRPRATTVEDAAGGVALRIVLLEDVTPFQALDRARREFVAAVSHELRTPLTSLGVALDLLLRELVGPLAEAQRDLLATAKSDQERLKRLVGGLIALARLEAGGAPPRREAVDAALAVHAALDGLRLQAQQEGVALEARFDPGLPPLWADPEQLGWVVTNLAGNALRHTPRGGRVTVRLDGAPHEGDGAGGALRLTVEDTGPGVPAEAAERIFEPFVQLDGAEARPGSAGLGLAIARRAVEAHGGRIHAEPGPGGRFVVMWPVGPPPHGS
jgi:NtrC-family two-component system sensor histidine kinase KinB